MNQDPCLDGRIDDPEFEYVLYDDFEHRSAGLSAEQRAFLKESRAWTEQKWDWANDFIPVDDDGNPVVRQPATPEGVQFDRELGARLGVSFEQLGDDAWKHVTPCPQRAASSRPAGRDGTGVSDAEVMACYRNYVCDTCYAPLGECTCHACWGPDSKPWGLVWVDPAIQEHIGLLKNKGYLTEFCCAGHEPGEGPCIQFACLHPLGLTLPVPPGYTWHKFRATLYATPLDPDTARAMTPQELQEHGERLLADLLAWCRDLPNHDGDWYSRY